MIEPEQISTAGTLAGGARLRTLVVGLELHALALGLPVAEHGLGGAGMVAVAALPLVALVVGEALRHRAPRAARGVLIGAFPALLALAVGSRPDLSGRDAWAGVVAPLVALSLLLYTAVVLHSFARPAPSRASGWQPVPEAAWTSGRPGRAVAAAVLAGTLAVALVATAILPFATSRAALEARFPGAGDDARLLAVALGGGLFAVALAAVVGPGTRARRIGDEARERVGRSVVASLTVAGLAAAGYAWLVVGR